MLQPVLQNPHPLQHIRMNPINGTRNHVHIHICHIHTTTTMRGMLVETSKSRYENLDLGGGGAPAGSRD